MRAPTRLLTMLQASPLFTAELLAYVPPTTEAEARVAEAHSTAAAQRMGRVAPMRSAIRELAEQGAVEAVEVLTVLRDRSVIRGIREEAAAALSALDDVC